jgi:hypothetical protein
MYALAAVQMAAETRMRQQPHHLTLTGILPMGYRTEALPNESSRSGRSARSLTFSTACGLRRGSARWRRPQAIEAKEHLP